ncbi:MAG: polyribonucleotide nucleotidyltransferase [Bacteroidota bacterium]|nr:polyribonucleotide nucleotidyltransferase [Bacteroidota bacterium]MDP4226869.1 polyribonucleotide nucleotidyltransferase [Bacteroidota bacterium]MDP4274697.1 polyribonucleotide nucleotidyltransferase [Bacteroidota bacterium]
MLNVIEKTIDLGDGRQITIQTGKLAKQADGSVVVKMGGTMLLATVVSAKEVKPDTDFMPLSVEYKEKFYSVGRFPGGFMKRESKAGDYEILIARLVDRALRPLFPDDYHAETFVTINLISAEKDIAPDALAGLAASSALMVSDIPFNGPVSEVRVARVDGKFIVNPSFSELGKADIEIMVGATYDNISMVEGEMNEVSEDDMAEALKFAHNYIKEQCKVQMELAKAVNKQKREYEPEPQDEELTKALHDYAYDKIYQIGKSALPKHQRDDGFTKIKEDFIESKKAEWEGNLTEEEINVKINIIKRDYEKLIREAIRNMILDEGIRIDGRKTNEIRPIWCEVDCLPAAHGSAIFTRGETQALASVTLGTKLDEKIIDEVLMQGREKFVLHYNFPPFATGEAKSARGLSRREIGHGNLAHRALKRMIPPDIENPYAIRVVSEILESNGSSSMATVCAGTMALMDAGVKIKRPVSGIAMGLITDASGKFAVLSDILGDEDHFGDMDFKVCGTIEGITACQMDIKIDGLSYDILGKALAQAKEGRHFILGKLLETIPEPRADYKPHAPRIVQITIPKETIGALIGPGGKIIQEIQSDTKTTITIEEVDSKGFVSVFGENKEALDAAMRRINAIVEVPEVGKIYKGKVKSIMPFGAFIEILPGKDGLLHISEIEWRRIEKVEDVLKEGQEIEVKLIDIDKKTGKLKLSRKVLLPKPAKADVKE